MGEGQSQVCSIAMLVTSIVCCLLAFLHTSLQGLRLCLRPYSKRQTSEWPFHLSLRVSWLQMAASCCQTPEVTFELCNAKLVLLPENCDVALSLFRQLDYTPSTGIALPLEPEKHLCIPGTGENNWLVPSFAPASFLAHLFSQRWARVPTPDRQLE